MRKWFRDLRINIARKWVTKEDDYSLARAFSPILANNSLVYLLFPTSLFAVAGKLFISKDWDWFGLVLGIWFVLVALIIGSIAAKWFLIASGLATLVDELEESRRRIAVAMVEVVRRNPGYFHILHWLEDIEIAKDGVATITRTVRLEVGEHQMDMFWSDLVSYGPVVDEDDVEVQAWELHDGNRRTALHPDVVFHADPHLRTSVYISFGTPRPKETEVRLRVQWKWPRFYEKLLVDHDPNLEPLEYKLTRRCDELEIKIQAFVEKGRALVVRDQENVSSADVLTPRGRKNRENITIKAARLPVGTALKARIVSTEKDRAKS